MPSYHVVSTPNPDSLMFVADKFTFIEGGMLSASTVEQADGHELSELLCCTPGVSNVFVVPAFLTVTKDAEAEWDTVLPEVDRVLHGFLNVL